MDFDFQDYIRQMEEQAKNNDIGKYFVKSIGVSMDESAYLAVTALENVYVELETVTKNAQKNAEKLAKKRQERELKNLKNSLDLYLITEQEYYEKLKQYRDENVRKGSDTWYKITDDIIQYNKKLWETALKEQQKLEKEQLKFAEKLDSIRQKLNEKVESVKIDFAEKIQELQDEFANSLRSVEEDWVDSKKIRFLGINKDGTDLVYFSDKINDFSKEINILRRFYSAVLQLKKLEYFPDEFFAEIAGMDPEKATETMEKLLVASDEKRRKFVDGYVLKNTLADQIAQELNGVLNKSELEDAMLQAENELNDIFEEGVSEQSLFATQLEKYFDDIPQEYYKLGENTALSFSEGFKSIIEKIVQESRHILMGIAEQFALDFSLKVNDTKESIYENNSNVYNNSYTFNSSGETTTQQLAAAKAAATLEKLRGGI